MCHGVVKWFDMWCVTDTGSRQASTTRPWSCWRRPWRLRRRSWGPDPTAWWNSTPSWPRFMMRWCMLRCLLSFAFQLLAGFVDCFVIFSFFFFFFFSFRAVSFCVCLCVCVCVCVCVCFSYKHCVLLFCCQWVVCFPFRIICGLMSASSSSSSLSLFFVCLLSD